MSSRDRPASRSRIRRRRTTEARDQPPPPLVYLVPLPSSSSNANVMESVLLETNQTITANTQHYPRAGVALEHNHLGLAPPNIQIGIWNYGAFLGGALVCWVVYLILPRGFRKHYFGAYRRRYARTRVNRQALGQWIYPKGSSISTYQTSIGERLVSEANARRQRELQSDLRLQEHGRRHKDKHREEEDDSREEHPIHRRMARALAPRQPSPHSADSSKQFGSRQSPTSTSDVSSKLFAFSSQQPSFVSGDSSSRLLGSSILSGLLRQQQQQQSTTKSAMSDGESRATFRGKDKYDTGATSTLGGASTMAGESVSTWDRTKSSVQDSSFQSSASSRSTPLNTSRSAFSTQSPEKSVSFRDPPSPRHPSIKRIPSSHIVAETMRRLAGRGIRLMAHGVQTDPKRVWIRFDGATSALTWQTEFPRRVPTSSPGEMSIVLMRGNLHKIGLANVLYIDVGKRTSALLRTNKSIPDTCCFSLLTQNGSLDLQTNSNLERDALVSCFSLLLDQVHEGNWRAMYEEGSSVVTESDFFASDLVEI